MHELGPQAISRAGDSDDQSTRVSRRPGSPCANGSTFVAHEPHRPTTVVLRCGGADSTAAVTAVGTLAFTVMVPILP
jgi:hypothetical protein